jgi:hypothetical protein
MSCGRHMNSMLQSDVPMSDSPTSALQRRTMTPATREFHATVIRLLKGIITAWERWLQQQEIER